MPPNLLRNRVRSFINSSDPRAAILSVLADAMSDPALQVIDEGGRWRIADADAKARASQLQGKL